MPHVYSCVAFRSIPFHKNGSRCWFNQPYLQINITYNYIMLNYNKKYKIIKIKTIKSKNLIIF